MRRGGFMKLAAVQPRTGVGTKTRVAAKLKSFFEVTMDHVKATFGGKPAVFYLSRKSLQYGIHGDAYDLLRRFISGHWNVQELHRVLRDAYRDGEGKVDHSGAAHVSDVLNKNGPGHYVALAAKTLEAALFGIPEKNAVFDEAKQLAGEAA